MTIWPSGRGDHRGSLRGRAAGAAHGRVRWRWTADHAIGAVLVGDGRIYAQAGPAIHVLDPTGAPLARLVPELEGMRLLALVADAAVVRTARGVAAIDAAGAIRWEHATPLELRAVGVGPEDELYLWALDTPRRLNKRSELTCLAPDGSVAWTLPHALPLSGYVLGMELACDDEGIVYTLGRTRIGDGVSGDDLAAGGVAAYDRIGCRWARRSLGGARLDHVHGLPAGAIGRGRGAVCYTRDGDVAWTVGDTRGDREAPLIEVDGFDGGLRIEPRLAMLPERLHDPGPGRSQTGVACSFDDAGNTYFGRLLWSPPRVDRLCSLAREQRLRWQLEVPEVAYAAGVPVIGPDATVLFARGPTLTAIE